MPVLIFPVFFLILLHTLPPATASSSLPLDDANFQTVVRDSAAPWVVLFYASWDGHAKVFLPVWEPVAERLPERGVFAGQYDYGEYRNGERSMTRRVADELRIKYSTEILYFAPGRKDRPVRYRGARQVEAIVRWVEEKMREAGAGEEERTQCDDGHGEDL